MHIYNTYMYTVYPDCMQMTMAPQTFMHRPNNVTTAQHRPGHGGSLNISCY